MSLNRGNPFTSNPNVRDKDHPLRSASHWRRAELESGCLFNWARRVRYAQTFQVAVFRMEASTNRLCVPSRKEGRPISYYEVLSDRLMTGLTNVRPDELAYILRRQPMFDLGFLIFALATWGERF
jgi:hypothetical protein